MKDLLRQIGNSKSIATIFFPKAGTTLQYDSRHRVISQFARWLCAVARKKAAVPRPSAMEEMARRRSGGRPRRCDGFPTETQSRGPARNSALCVIREIRSESSL